MRGLKLGVRLCAVALVAAFLGAAPLPATGAEPYREASLALGEGLLALFPVVEGYVISATGGEAYVDVARKDLVKPGMELQVYRPGAEMIHPVTRAVLGSYEKSLGVLNVTEVREKYSRGTLDAAGEAAGIVAGDRVRLSARRLRTLLHVAGGAGVEVGPLAQALIARGEQSGRFAMIDEPAWAAPLAALGAPWEVVRADSALLRRLGELAAADLLLLATIESGNIPRVAVEVRSLRTGSVLAELSERLPATAPASGASASPAAARSTPAAPPPAASAPSAAAAVPAAAPPASIAPPPAVASAGAPAIAALPAPAAPPAPVVPPASSPGAAQTPAAAPLVPATPPTSGAPASAVMPAAVFPDEFPVPAPPKPAAPGPVAGVPTQAPEEYIVRDLASPARGLAVGNILGDGRLDVVLTDGSRLSLYRWEAQSLAWRWDEDGRGGRRILSIDAADVDGDGRSEVLVTTVARGRVTSELRRWQDGALKVAASVDGVYLRAASRPVAPGLVLGQRSGLGEVLTGRVEQYRRGGASFEPVEGSSLPRGVGIFGLALAPAGGPVALYHLDRAGYIFGLAQTGALAWRSTRPYGGYPPYVTAVELFGSGFIEEQDFDAEARAFQGRLLAEQAPEGVRLVVPRNFSDSPVLLTRQRTLGQGEVVIFAGPAESPEEMSRSRAFDGYVADLARADVDGDGSAEILFVVNRNAGLLQGERGKIVAWRPAGPRKKEIKPLTGAKPN